MALLSGIDRHQATVSSSMGRGEGRRAHQKSQLGTVLLTRVEWVTALLVAHGSRRACGGKGIADQGGTGRHGGLARNLVPADIVGHYAFLPRAVIGPVTEDDDGRARSRRAAVSTQIVHSASICREAICNVGARDASRNPDGLVARGVTLPGASTSVVTVCS